MVLKQDGNNLPFSPDDFSVGLDIGICGRSIRIYDCDDYTNLLAVYIDYYDKLPITLRSLFESWIDIPIKGPIGNLCRFMRKDRENSKKWLYFIAGNEEITEFHTTPIRIIKDLQHIPEKTPSTPPIQVDGSIRTLSSSTLSKSIIRLN
jgi:hypothetical protein